MIKLKDILEGSVTGDIKGVKGYTAFINPSQWNSKKKSLEKSVSKTTGYIMVGSKELVKPDDETYRSWKRPAMMKMKPLLERVDYHDTASEIIKSYKLKSKVNFSSGAHKGDYNWKKDIINLRPNYSSVKEFLMTILHEIRHALDAQNLGRKKFMKKYTQAGTVAAYDGLDPHDDNKWEERAEKFAKKEISKWA